MHKRRSRLLFIPGILLCLFFSSACKDHKKENEISLADTPEQIQEKVIGLIHDLLRSGDSSLDLQETKLTRVIYEKKQFAPIWSDKQNWKPLADSLFEFISEARSYGLFPEDYHESSLENIRNGISDDSLSIGDRKNARQWAIADLQLTDAFMQIMQDVKMGRLPNDSITLSKDSILNDGFFLEQFARLNDSVTITQIIQSLEPTLRGYQLIRGGIKKFLDSADFGAITIVPSPKDSLHFKQLLQKRLFEGGYISLDSLAADSSQLAQAVKKFQKDKGITVDGVAGEGTIRLLNLSDREKYIRIAISLDKYKKLPLEMPSKYIWVNTSSNFLEVIEDGELKFSSKVICGKPKTRTPLLNSAVSALITYPQWVPPPSIVMKEILPAVKKNPGYLAKKGFSLLDSKGDEVDPYTVDWTKYNKGIPYKVVQGSGDANALGILKFHFENKYSVYLHDTNQRYLFANAMRSLSHGCVRVQEWKQLMYYILQNDSLHYKGRYTKIDSVNTWLKNKEKHQVPVQSRMPVFIRYFTCVGHNGRLEFYDDVYGEDKRLKEKFFALK